MPNKQVNFSDIIKRVYSDYFGYAPRIREKADGGMISLSGFSTFLHPVEWLDIIHFWEYRLQNNKTERDAFCSADFSFLEDLQEDEMYPPRVLAVILCIDYRRLLKHIPEHDTLKEVFHSIISYKTDNTVFTYKEQEKGITEWANDLNISTNTFKYRLYLHGKHDVIFLTQDKYYDIPFHRRRKMKTHRRFQTIPRSAPDPYVRCNVDYKDAKTLVINLIQDAKNNLICKNNPFYDESSAWLCNECGGLENLVSYIEEFSNESVNYLLEECYKYGKKR